MQWDVARRLRTEVRDVLERADVPLAGQRDLLAAHRPRLEAAHQAKRVREPFPGWPWMP